MANISNATLALPYATKVRMSIRNNRSASLPSVVIAALLMLFVGSSSSATCFTVAPSRVVPTHRAVPLMVPSPPRPLHSVGGQLAGGAKSTTATSLRMISRNDTYGIGRGTVILALVMIANVWMFSIPTEFRRARICTDEDVRLHPEEHCTTFASWRTGVAEYYANGGGVKFDFSIEGKE